MDLQQGFLERLLQGNDVSDEVRTWYTDQINEIEDQFKDAEASLLAQTPKASPAKRRKKKERSW